MVTVGWVVKAVPPVAPAGSVENANCAGRPTVTSNGALGAVKVSNQASVAVRTSPVLAVLIVQPLKAATPAVVVDVQPESAPEPVVRLKVMACVSGTVLPPASSSVTVGWVVKAVPPVAPAGSGGEHEVSGRPDGDVER